MKKATEMHPKMTAEAERMLAKLRVGHFCIIYSIVEKLRYVTWLFLQNTANSAYKVLGAKILSISDDFNINFLNANSIITFPFF